MARKTMRGGRGRRMPAAVPMTDTAAPPVPVSDPAVPADGSMPGDMNLGVRSFGGATGAPGQMPIAIPRGKRKQKGGA